jgi:hypothetical protein
MGKAMRKLVLATALLPALFVLAGCPKKTSDADAAATTEEASTVAVVEAGPVAPTAKNANDVARFGTDAPIANEQAKILAAFAQAHTSPRGGTLVATLKPGTDVTKIASHQNDSFLVTFADPKDANSVLMGWVGHEAFSPTLILDAGPRDAAIDAAVRLVCAAGTIAVFLGGDTICKKKCNADKDCPNALAGSCVLGATGGPGGKAVHVCNN